MVDHDHSYKNLFSHAQMVEDLFKGFVEFDWVADLDFSTLEKLNNSYITDDLRDRADDIVWRVNPFMSLRIMTYVGLLYQDLIKAKQLPESKRLPPVLPVVLYNGEKRWNAAESISELLQAMPEQLQVFQPQQRYLLIDEGRYSVDELGKLENLTAALIRAELAETPEDIVRVLANLVVWLGQPKQRELRRAFNEWFRRILPNRMPGTQFDKMRDLTEYQTMLSERVKDWTKGWREEGFRAGVEEGIEKGIEKGVNQGEALLLLKQLTKRFGDLPIWAKEKISQANRQQLEVWGERIFDVKTLDELFE
ncbi:MAG: Rpn family recombination-promoting nuclease/putative transposase [Exilibacterium sp.]